MTAVVDLWIDIEICKTWTKRPDIGLLWVENLALSEGIFEDHHGQSKVCIHASSCLAGEGLDSRDVASQDEVVNVVGAFVSFYRLKVGHVAHDGIFVENTVGTVDVP